MSSIVCSCFLAFYSFVCLTSERDTARETAAPNGLHAAIHPSPSQICNMGTCVPQVLGEVSGHKPGTFPHGPVAFGVTLYHCVPMWPPGFYHTCLLSEVERFSSVQGSLTVLVFVCEYPCILVTHSFIFFSFLYWSWFLGALSILGKLPLVCKISAKNFFHSSFDFSGFAVWKFIFM